MCTSGMILGEFPGYTVKTVYPGYFPHNPKKEIKMNQEAKEQIFTCAEKKSPI
jgi:hypothetical protein